MSKDFVCWRGEFKVTGMFKKLLKRIKNLSDIKNEQLSFFKIRMIQLKTVQK